LGFFQAQNTTKALSALGLPALVVGDGGSVIAANPEMEALSPRIRTGAQNRLSLKSATANALLQATLTQSMGQRTPALQSIPIPADHDYPALILHFLPVKRKARGIFSKSAAIMIARRLARSGLRICGCSAGSSISLQPKRVWRVRSPWAHPWTRSP
jgi:hypothetical protein